MNVVARQRLPVDGVQAVAMQDVMGGGGGVVSVEHVPDVFVPVVVRDERGGLPGGVPLQPEGNLKTRLVCLKRMPEQRRDRDGDQEPVDHEAHAAGAGVEVLPPVSSPGLSASLSPEVSH